MEVFDWLNFGFGLALLIVGIIRLVGREVVVRKSENRFYSLSVGGMNILWTSVVLDICSLLFTTTNKTDPK